MPNIYIEYREEEKDYAVRKEGAKRASETADTQKEAIEIAKKLAPNSKPLVERVRDTKVGGRDKWRPA
jgi:uncharacterized protein YdaT